jgi:hypothetical protein
VLSVTVWGKEAQERPIRLEVFIDFTGSMISGMRMAEIPYLAKQKILTTSIHCDPLESAKFVNNLIRQYSEVRETCHLITEV